MGKTGLVVEGGGMKCAYCAGVLDQFLEHGITFDYCIGVSAGAASVASYLAGQKGRNLRFYTEYIDDPWYFGMRSFLKNGDLFNLKYTKPYDYTRIDPAFSSECSQQKLNGLIHSLKHQKRPFQYRVPQVVLEEIRPEWLVKYKVKT